MDAHPPCMAPPPGSRPMPGARPWRPDRNRPFLPVSFLELTPAEISASPDASLVRCCILYADLEQDLIVCDLDGPPGGAGVPTEREIILAAQCQLTDWICKLGPTTLEGEITVQIVVKLLEKRLATTGSTDTNAMGRLVELLSHVKPTVTQIAWSTNGQEN